MVPAFASPTLLYSIGTGWTRLVTPPRPCRVRNIRPQRGNMRRVSVVRAVQQSSAGAAAAAADVHASSAPLRIGHGFDLHRLEPGLPLILGGVTLKHERGCAGHSDGDAVYHCVVDAVLGALSLPDIGQLFPDTDPRFKDAASSAFMIAAQELVAEKGYRVGNVDVTVILERPKLSPHKEKIRANIATLLQTHLGNVNVKAKTHEKVDAVGENRAVSVHAVALLVADERTGGATRGVEEEDTVVTSDREDLLAASRNVAGDLLKGVGGAGGSGNVDGIQRLYNNISSRQGADPASSWTARLFSKGRAKIAQKVGEEAVEVVIEATRNINAPSPAQANVGVVRESADLLYHLNVLWADMGIKPEDVFAELKSREGTSGLVEKANRAPS